MSVVTGQTPSRRPWSSFRRAKKSRRRCAFRNIGAIASFAVSPPAQLFAVLMVALMAFKMWQQSRLSLEHFGWHFLFDGTWDPVREVFGAWPFVVGTIASSVLALVLAVRWRRVGVF